MERKVEYLLARSDITEDYCYCCGILADILFTGRPGT